MLEKLIGIIEEQLNVEGMEITEESNFKEDMSSAAIPVLLDELNRCGIIKRTHKIVLSAVGAGLTYGACVIKW